MIEPGATVLVVSAPNDPDSPPFLGQVGIVSSIRESGVCLVDFPNGDEAACVPDELASMSWQTALEHNASIIYDGDPEQPLVYIDQVDGSFSVSIAASGMAPDVLEHATAEEVQAKLEAWGEVFCSFPTLAVREHPGSARMEEVVRIQWKSLS